MIESKTHEEIHKDAVEVSGRYLSSEAKLISVLQEVDQNRTYLAYNESSLFAYATHKLRLSENVASTLIGIARKSVEIPELKEAIEKGEIPVSSARRLVPILTLQNSDEWLTKAKALAQKQLDFELARAFPGRPEPTRVRMKSGELARLEVDIDLETVALLCKLKDLLSQKELLPIL